MNEKEKELSQTRNNISEIIEDVYYVAYLAGQNAKGKRTSEEINRAAKLFALDIKSQSTLERK